jgi:ubiquinone/menaquinone biosynthesis C-methylase UbiE
MDTKTHWETIYQTRPPTQVGWYQARPSLSLDFIQRLGLPQAASVIDVGGGASTLVDSLLEAGYSTLTVLDLSGTALDLARRRLGSKAHAVTWLEADVTQADLPADHFDLWHDRAVFHFLTEPEQRRRYVNQVERSVKRGGQVIVATFASDGPNRCSGLDVVQYTPLGLQAEFGSNFELLDSARETHHTPSGTEQKFVYCYCRRL